LINFFLKHDPLFSYPSLPSLLKRVSTVARLQKVAGQADDDTSPRPQEGISFARQFDNLCDAIRVLVETLC